MATPIQQSNGSTSGLGTIGEGRNDLVISETVALSDTEALNIGASYVWTLADIPIGSATAMINATTATPSFVPDITGSYRVLCTVNGTDTSEEVFAVPLPISGGRMPSFNEELQYDEGGTTKGWHYSMTLLLRAMDTAIGAAGVTLDGAYDLGGPGVGRAITADSGAVQVTNPNADAANVLELITTASATGAALAITNAGDGAALTWDAGQTLAPDGTEALPAYSFVGSASTGPWSPGTDIFAISTAGSEAVRYDASQNATFSGKIYAPTGGGPSAPGVAFGGDTNTGMYRNTADTLGFACGAQAVLVLSDTANTAVLTQVAQSTGSPVAFTLTGAAHLTLTASTEAPSVLFDLSATAQFDTGAIADQRAIKVLAPTYAAVGASVITNGSTVSISGPPIAGTNVTITNPAALRVESGQSLFPDGSTALPSVAQAADPSTGLEFPSSSRINFIAGGVLAAYVTNLGLWLGNSAKRLSVGTGSAAVPSLRNSGDSDTGFFFDTIGEGAATAAGSEVFRWNASQQVLFADGLVGAPAWSWATDPATGFYLTATGVMRVAVSGGEIMNFTSSNAQMAQTLRPATDNSITLGSSSRHWSTVYGRQYRSRYDAIGVAATHGIEIQNTTAAVADVTPPDGQQWSPMLVFEGQGWKTDATAASQEVLFAIQNETIQGAANPTGALAFRSNINAAGYTEVARITSGGGVEAAGKFLAPDGSAGAGAYTFTNDETIRMYRSGSSLRFAVSNLEKLRITTAKVFLGPSMLLSSLDDTDSSVDFLGSDIVTITTGGVEAIRWNASQQTLLPDGSAAAPAVALASAPTTGVYGAVGNLYLGISGSPELRVTSTYTRFYGSYIDPNADYGADLGQVAKRWKKAFVGDLSATPQANTTGADIDISYTAPAHTGLTASTEIPSILFDLSATKRWATGAITDQRFIKILAPTMGFTLASTVTGVAATVAISGPPIAGAGPATLDNPAALWVESGQILIGDGTAAAPSYSSSTNTGTGWYTDGTGTEMKFSVDGVHKMSISSGGAGDDLIMQFDGTEAVPAITNGSINTGVWWPTDDDFAVSTNGGEAVRWVISQRQENSNGITITQQVDSAGTPSGSLELVGAAHTSLTNAEAVDVLFNLGRTVQFDGGVSTTIASQSAFKVLAPTYSAALSDLTITDAATLRIDSAPAAGANTTITNSYALWVDSGKTRLDGELQIGGALNHDGTTLGFYGTTPVAVSPAYSTLGSTDRTFSSSNLSTSELTDILGTLIGDLQATGLLT